MADWLHSTSVRLSLAFATLVVVAFVAAGVLIWHNIGVVADRQIRQQVELEVNAIERELVAEGLDAAIAAIDSRAERPGAFVYWLSGPDGRRLVGDASDLREGWHELAISGSKTGGQDQQHLLVLTKQLGTGYRLSVGEDLSRSAALQAAILRTIVSVGMVTVLVCLLAGAIITARALQKIERLNATIDAAGRGDLSARYAAEHAHTDIDDIGTGIDLMLERIETLLGNVQRVSRDVAHDLRTPLMHLRQRVEAMIAAGTHDVLVDKADEALRKIDDIIRMFDATLRLAEIDSGSVRQRFQDVSLAGIVRNVVDAYRPDVEESGRQLNIGRLDNVTVSGDESLLTQAIANLLENAMRHTPDGARIEVSVISDGCRTSLVVADDGCGIPVEARSRVVEPFLRLDASRTSGGAGLGLSIVAAIARAHQAGLVLADARPGLKASLVWGA